MEDVEGCVKDDEDEIIKIFILFISVNIPLW